MLFLLLWLQCPRFLLATEEAAGNRNGQCLYLLYLFSSGVFFSPLAPGATVEKLQSSN